MIRIAEQCIAGKDGKTDGEDRIVHSPQNGFIAVLDGASGKPVQGIAGHRGLAAVNCLETAIKILDSQATMETAVDALTKALYEIYRAGGEGLMARSEADATQRCVASGVLFSAYRSELWMVGDCQALVNGVHFQSRRSVDEVTILARCEVVRRQVKRFGEESVRKGDQGRRFIEPLLAAQGAYQNNPDSALGYAAFDGYPIPLSMIRVETVRAGDEVVLASDGYPSLRTTLGASEDDLAALLAADPLCYDGNPQTKGLLEGNVSYDDRAYLRFFA